MRWRLILEEYGPELRYIQGEKNIVADALSRIEMEMKNPANPAEMLNNIAMIGTPKFKDKTQQELFYQYQIANTVEIETYPDCPIELSYLKSQQDKDEKIQDLLNDKEKYHTKTFLGAGKAYEMICRDNRIVIPQNF